MKIRSKKLISLLTAVCLTLGTPLSAIASREDPISLKTAISEEELTPNQRMVYVSDLEWKSEKHTVDSELPTQKDLSFGREELSLKVDGSITKFKKGIGTQTDSTIEYNVEGKGYTKFLAYAGVNSSKAQFAPEGDVQFRVYIDNVLVKETGTLDGSSNAELIEVDIPKDAKTLKLYADKIKMPYYDHANWADARFIQTLPEPQNVALGKKVAAKKTADNSAAPANPDSKVSSDKAVDGVITMLNYFDFGDQRETGAQRESLYLQLDLGGSFLLSDISMWRYWDKGRTYSATVIAVSNDENFENSTVIFNSDKAGTIHNLGQGSDDLYAESNGGKTFNVPADTKARYIRVYVNGVEGGGVTNHIVELQVNAYVFGDEIEPGDPGETSGKIFPNAKEPLVLEGIGTDGQVTHPDVKVFDEPWNGYKYWMAYTPNKPGSSYFENPCIAASNDGINWEFPATNPVQPRYDSQIENQNEHNCDTDIVYDPDNNRLIMYWEWAQDVAVNGKTHRSEIRYRISYDGINWGIEGEDGVIQTGPTDHGCAIASEGERYSDLSPTVVYDEKEDMYKMWANDAGDIGYNNKEKNKVWYRTSQDGLTGWSDKTYVENFLGVNEEGLQMYPWHQDVQWIEEFQEYWALQQAFPAGSGPDSSSLRFSKSKDGINWEPVSDKALITVGEPGSWDAGQIYRSTFWYEPSGGKGQGTFHIWYAALAERQSHWDIGYTSANYSDVMFKLTGERPAVEKRMRVDNEHPLLIMPLYGKSYSEQGSTLDWGDDLVLRWNAVPEDLKENAVIEIHVGGKIGLNESDSHTTKAFYEQQLAVAQENNIPVFIVVATAGLKNYWTGTSALTAEWADQMFKQFSVLKGIMSTENYWTDYGAVANIGAEYMKVAAENGGYFIWSEHQEGVIEDVVANPKFNKALNEYGDSFIFTWKNTPANTNSNAGTASYMQGLWLTGMCAQWGGLADTWKWYEKGFGRLFGGRQNYNPGGEEARPVATQPEALLAIEMMSIYTNGGSVYNFEHPAYVYGSYNKNSPAFENTVAEFMRYAIANPAPSKEEVLADTKVAFYGSLNNLKSKGKLLQQGINWEDATLPTQSSGRYGLIPAVPSSVASKIVNEAFAGITLIDQNTPELTQTNTKKEFFESKYDKKYEGTAFGQLVKDVWYLYNSNVNVDGEQHAKLPLEDNKTVDVTMTPHTYVILNHNDGVMEVKLNNYRVNKDSIWEGYGATVLDRWDTDHNTALQDWVSEVYIPNPDDNTFRNTTFELTDMTSEPVIEVTRGLEDQYDTPKVTYNEAAQTARITVNSNGYVDFTIKSEEVEVVVKDILKQKISEAIAIQKGNYTDTSYQALQEAIKSAQFTVDSPDADQAEVEAQTAALIQAIEGLTLKADLSVLKAKLAQAEAIQKGNYTDASYKVLTDAIAAAKLVAANPDAIQLEVDAQAAALTKAIEGLTIKPVDFSALNAKIIQASGIKKGTYTDDSFKMLTDAIASAKKTAADKNATQATVDAQATALTKAIQGLKEKSASQIAEEKMSATTVKAKAANTDASKIKLSWDRVNHADGYVISIKSGKSWKTETTLKKNNTTSYTYTKGSLGKSYTFRVKAYKKISGKTIYSSYKPVTKKAIPQTVTMKAKPTKGKVTISFKKVSGVTGYSIEKKMGNKWKKLAMTNSKTLKFTDKDVRKGKKYSYRVKAYKSQKGKKVYGSYSKPITIKTK